MDGWMELTLTLTLTLRRMDGAQTGGAFIPGRARWKVRRIHYPIRVRVRMEGGFIITSFIYRARWKVRRIHYPIRVRVRMEGGFIITSMYIWTCKTLLDSTPSPAWSYLPHGLPTGLPHGLPHGLPP